MHAASRRVGCKEGRPGGSPGNEAGAGLLPPYFLGNHASAQFGWVLNEKLNWASSPSSLFDTASCICWLTSVISFRSRATISA